MVFWVLREFVTFSAQRHRKHLFFLLWINPALFASRASDLTSFVFWFFCFFLFFFLFCVRGSIVLSLSKGFCGVETIWVACAFILAFFVSVCVGKVVFLFAVGVFLSAQNVVFFLAWPYTLHNEKSSNKGHLSCFNIWYFWLVSIQIGQFVLFRMNISHQPSGQYYNFE